MSWLMNRMFNVTTRFQKVYWRSVIGEHNSVRGAQTMLFNDLDARE